MWVGATQCPEIIVEKSDEIFSCINPPGTGGRKDIFINVIGSTWTIKQAFAYDVPSVTAIYPDKIPSSGSPLLTVYGESFGAFDMTPKASIFGKAYFSCRSTRWMSDSSMACSAPPVGPGSEKFNNTVQVVVDGFSNSLAERERAHFDYLDLATYLAACPQETSEECHDCVVTSCYKITTSRIQSGSSGVLLGDVMDVCEAEADLHCLYI